jgi:hypothetical protein
VREEDEEEEEEEDIPPNVRMQPPLSAKIQKKFPYKMDDAYVVGLKQATQVVYDWRQSEYSYANQASPNEKILVGTRLRRRLPALT